jgi:multiple sugar transport system substrate-binding protein
MGKQTLKEVGMKRKACSTMLVGVIMLVASLTWANGTKEGGAAGSSAQPAVAGGPESVYFYHWTSAESIDEMIKAFGQKYPNIKVVYKVLADSIAATGNVILASGERVDVMGEASMDTVRQRVQAGMYAPLDSFMKTDDVSFMKMGGVNVDSLEKIGSHYYSLPYGLTTRGLFFNKDLFDKAGVPYPTDNSTWMDVKAMAKKVTSGSGVSTIWGFLPDYDFVDSWDYPAIEKLGLNYIYKADGKSSNFDNPWFLYSLKLLYEMEQVDNSAWPISQYQTLNMASNYAQEFLQGKTAMYIGHPFTPYWTGLGKTAEHPMGSYGYTGFRYGVVNLPKVDASDPMRNTFYTSDLSIPVSSQHKDAAWTFIKDFCLGNPVIMAKDKGMLYVSMQGTIAPSLVSQMGDALFNYPGGFEKPDGIRVFLKNKPELVSIYTTITTAKLQINSMVTQEVTSCLLGNETPEQAIANMKSKADDLIKAALAQ